ncbi:CYTH domain-containing protein [Leifsonia sp. NPDC058248]|uniref:CYTH domain-containing protein n=1 Tax=Leifsonia sp. NPDC058248 TaxID=3346402 RepID=UPI0036DF662F
MPYHSQIEIERKYDVDESAEPPRLVGAGAVAIESEPATAELVAIYIDTDDLTLARQRVAVRVRRGGADAGWHVKLPGDEGRTELHWPIGDGEPDEPPAELLAMLRERVGDAELRPIARVTNNRTTVILQDAAGFAVAELCDDHVSSENLHAGGTRSWREWEVELLGGAPDTREARAALLDEIEERILGAGAVVSASSSKLAHALGL